MQSNPNRPRYWCPINSINNFTLPYAVAGTNVSVMIPPTLFSVGRRNALVASSNGNKHHRSPIGLLILNKKQWVTLETFKPQYFENFLNLFKENKNILL